MKLVKYSIFIFLLFGQIFAQVSISLPDTSAQQGNEILIPVYTSSITDSNVVSYQFMITFDEAILSAVDIVTDETLTPSGWFAVANINVDGQISVAASGATATSGEGVLIYLKFNVVGTSGTTNLEFDNFIYNSGEPAVNLSNGNFSVEEIQVGVSIPSITSSTGQEILVPINTEDITDLNVVSYQFTVSFDETKIDAIDLVTDGSLTPSGWFAVANTNIDGQISVAASGATSTSGEGVLIYLKFNVVGTSGTTNLEFDNFLYNAGVPSVVLTDGSVSILPNIGWCNLQWPESINIVQGQSENIYAQIWIDGFTSEVGATEQLESWIGFSQENSNPSTWSEDSWFTADFNADVGNNDEFTSDVPSTLNIGTYYYASRFRYAGQEFSYGGYSSGGGGFWDGTVNYSGSLIIRDTIFAPTELSVETNSSQVSLSWADNSENELGFYIEKKLSGSTDFTPIDTLTENTNNFVDTDVVQGETYQYRVKAFNNNTESSYSNIAEGTIPIENIPAPSNLVASEITFSTVIINWTDNADNETGFFVERKSMTDVDFITIDTLGINVISYVDDNDLLQTYSYEYRVQAFNEYTVSAYSNIVEVIIPAAEILPPSDLTATEETNGIQLTWVDNSSIEEYFVIERSQSNSNDFIQIDTLSENTTSYLDDNLEGGFRYYYRIYAFNEFTNSDYSDTTYSDFLVGIISDETLPSIFELFPNYPNPFNPSTVIKYALPKESNVKLVIYDILGKQVAFLVNETQEPGYYHVQFNADELGAGTYFYRLTAGNYVSVKKMLLLK